MIIIRLVGGLGNQMFQYALGRHLSIKNNLPLKLDAHLYTSTQPDTYKDVRVFGLGRFNIQAEVANRDEISKYFKFYENVWTRRMWRFSNKFSLTPFYKRTYVEEPQSQYFTFEENLLKNKYTNAYFSGYWQTEKYFKDIRKILLNDLSVKQPADNKNFALAAEIKTKNSVCLHIRRGNNTDPKNPFGTLSFEYYQKAINILEKKVDKPMFYIFSDDIKWVQDNFKIGHPAHYVDNREDQDYEDMRLMNLCKYFILANSTFSWWGAWLSQYADKVVITPKRLFQKIDMPNPDLYPESWINI